MLLSLLLVSVLTFTFNIQPVKAMGEVLGFDEIAGTLAVGQAYGIAGSNINDAIFHPRVTYENGPWAYAIASGDLNSDGLNDVVVTSLYKNIIDVFTQNPLGTLNPRVTYPMGSGSDSLGVAVGDVNNDGKDDVVATNREIGRVSVFLQNPLGTLNRRIIYAVGARPVSVKIGDLNSDGLNDVVVTNWGSNTISVLTQKPSGFLNRQVTYGAGSLPWGLAVGDVNGDSKVDVVAGNYDSDTISVYLQTASGTLSSQITYTGCDDPRGIDIGDVNSDGRNDVVVGNGRPGTIGIFTQNLEGNLNPMVSYRLTITKPPGGSEGPSFLAIGDVNSDGLNDVVVSIANVFDSPYTINVLTQEPAGILNPAFSLLASHVGDSRGIAICDLNGDERNDLVVADGYEAHTISVYTQRIVLKLTVIDFDPSTMNLKSKGQWITAYLQPPQGHNAEDIDATSILLNDTIHPILDPKYGFVTNPSGYLVDDNGDGILERMVRFDRAEVMALLSSGYTTLAITGEVNGISFEGTDTIRLINE